MGQSQIKNPRRIFSQQGGGGVDPALESRVEYLEQNEYKVTYYAEINSSSGTITIPTGATILLDQFFGGVDAYVSTISGGRPTGAFPQTAGGVLVDVSSFDASGNYTLSGTPSGYPVALIYILKIAAVDWQNLTTANILDMEAHGQIDASNIADGSVSNTEFQYLDGVTSNIQTQLNALNNLPLYDYTNGSNVTGSTSLEILRSVTVPANTFAVGNEIIARFVAYRDVTAGTFGHYLYYNTSNSLSGATLLATSTATGFRYHVIERNLWVDTSNTYVMKATTNASGSFNASTSIEDSIAIDWTITNYIIHAGQNAASGDIMSNHGYSIKRF